MKYICAILLVICIGEGIGILWFKRNIDKKIDIEETVRFFRNFWGRFVLYVIATSIIGLFLGSIYFKEIVGLDEINAWVGIVLGLVALIIGIISLFLSFYNVEQSNEVQRQTIEIMNTVKEDITKKINDMQSDISQKLSDMNNGNFKGQTEKEKMTATMDNKKGWKEVND